MRKDNIYKMLVLLVLLNKCVNTSFPSANRLGKEHRIVKTAKMNSSGTITITRALKKREIENIDKKDIRDLCSK